MGGFDNRTTLLVYRLIVPFTLRSGGVGCGTVSGDDAQGVGELMQYRQSPILPRGQIGCCFQIPIINWTPVIDRWAFGEECVP